jgi:hypothetical protein
MAINPAVLTALQTEYETAVNNLPVGQRPSRDQLWVLYLLEALQGGGNSALLASLGEITDPAIASAVDGSLISHTRKMSESLADLKTRLAGDQYPVGAVPLTDDNGVLFVLRQDFIAFLSRVRYIYSSR